MNLNEIYSFKKNLQVKILLLLQICDQATAFAMKNQEIDILKTCASCRSLRKIALFLPYEILIKNSNF